MLRIFKKSFFSLILILVFFLPFHAVIITFLGCKIGINTDLLRFWKEIIILFLCVIVSVKLLFYNDFILSKTFKGKYLLGTVVTFLICSFVYIYFPRMEITKEALLGFKYDIFFFLALIIGLYLSSIKENFNKVLMTLFSSIGLILLIFLPWYTFGDISNTSEILGFDKNPSTYEANACVSFSQNVTGGHNRFQGSFGDPIRFSVFLVVFYFIFLGFTLNSNKLNNYFKYGFILFITFIISLSVYFSYTKTSILGFLFGFGIFFLLFYKYRLGKSIKLSYFIYFSIFVLFIIGTLLYIKQDAIIEKFLHIEAVAGRQENLVKSLEMFLDNPIGYGLGEAGPATQLATSNDQTLSYGVTKFLPENWYIQILLEQGILGLALFISILLIIFVYLLNIIKKNKDYLSIGIFVSFISLLFMANFTHAFEETATSAILFLIIGAYLAKEKKDLV